MTHLTASEVDAVWAAIDDQRARIADLLDSLAPEQWSTPSLCAGWTVRHVAAHLTLQRQGVGDVLSFIAAHPSLLRSLGLNATIQRTAEIQAASLTHDELTAAIRAGIGSRRHNAFVTRLETLTDILVHSQDIAIPLGVDLPMDPAAAAIAATRRWDTRTSWMSSVFRQPPLAGYTLSATDVDWTRGDGPEVTGPISAILLLLTGRPIALEQLHGDGAEALRATFT